MKREDMRTPLARAIGLGFAKDGAHHWWMQRVSAIALVPLTVWFIAAIIAATGADYTAFVAWMRNPITDILMGLLLIALFYHAALGLQVVVEDYVHSAAKFAAMITVRLVLFHAWRRGHSGNTIIDSAQLIEAARLLRDAGTDIVAVCTSGGVLARVITKTDAVGQIRVIAALRHKSWLAKLSSANPVNGLATYGRS
jgi:succinate dehydrogenase / fumarate reductase, membrane anchor subunit